jgi:predicted metal-dependent peptidase
MARSRRRDEGRDRAREAWEKAVGIVHRDPLMGPLASRAYIRREPGDTSVPRDEWAVVFSSGTVACHPERRGSAEEWVYAISHCLLHLGLGHFDPAARDRDPAGWNAACDLAVEHLLSSLKLGVRPPEYHLDLPALPRRESEAYALLVDRGVPEGLPRDLRFTERPLYGPQPEDWPRTLAVGLRLAVTGAVARAAGRDPVADPWRDRPASSATRARDWMIANFPLLGALASAFEIVEDRETCQRHDIRVAAVDARERRIYVNPLAALSEEEMRFVMAHEILHVALRHHARREDRDPYLWNVACDYAINLGLRELAIGDLPPIGLLLDPDLEGLSAESIYDRIAKDLRMIRRLATFRGTGAPDMLGDTDEWWQRGDGATLEDFYRSALAQGLSYHEQQGRGLLPAGLDEEIRAQIQPPIPWEVQLANWFDGFFAPIETRRSYARPSRRQAATPDIPRPRTVIAEHALDGRTFGVVLDTSGSMDRVTLARALGSIASYAMSRDVPAVRVVFCDADAYDQGYMVPDAIAGNVRVRGRGGTLLQPGVDLLRGADDFPDDGPILLITDTWCEDDLRVPGEHAYLVPQGRRLPFPPKGPVFSMPPAQGET